MARKLRWGLLSTAKINQAVITPIKESERSELVAVSSRSGAKAQTYADENGIPLAFGNYADMLASPDIDAVYISLPNTLHAEWTVKAAQAGKHVLCEKPIVPTMQELDAIKQAARDNDVTIFEAFMYLHHPQTRKAREMIAQGRLGKLSYLSSKFTFYLDPKNSTNIRLNPNLAGGALWDVGVYPVSSAVYLTGGIAPKAIYATQNIGETGVDVSLSGQMHFADDVVAHTMSSFRMPFQQGISISGDEGMMHIPVPWKPSTNGKPALMSFTHRDGTEEIISTPPVNAYLCEVQAMEACVLDGAEPVVPLNLSRELLKTVLGQYESAQTGKLVTL